MPQGESRPQHKPSTRILVRRRATSALLAAVAMSYPALTCAEEVPPLREEKQNLHNIMSFLQIDGEITPYYPTAAIGIPFKSMIVAVERPSRLEQWDLMHASVDAQALADFTEKAIQTRLDELGVSDQIALHMSTVPWQKPLANCDEIRFLLSFKASEVKLDGRTVVAVVVDLESWQGATMPSQRVDSPQVGHRKTECLGDKAPPLTGRGPSKVYLVNRGDRENALAEAKQAILWLVDGPILLRLITMNDTARRTVVLWLYGEN